MPPLPTARRHVVLWSAAGLAATALAGLAVRRVIADRAAWVTEAALVALPDATAEALPHFSPAALAGLPEPARRYLAHAIAPGTPLAPAVRLWMDGEMTPTPGGARTRLTAVETLAPRRGFVWTARARMRGLPVRVRDHYHAGTGGIAVVAAGLVPVPMPSGEDVARSARGRLVAEAVWCPTALVGPGVVWEAVDDDRARYTITADGEAIPVTLTVGPDGALREVALERWGDVDGLPARPVPYGFRVDAEDTFGGVTIPSRITGGWHYGTPAFDPADAASFTVLFAMLASR